MKGLAVVLALLAGWAALAYARGPLHLGAPPLVYHCPPGHTLVTRWEKGVPASPAPGEVIYHGWTKYGACQDSMTITGG